MEQYKYVICLLTNDCYGYFIEGHGNEDDGCPVCCDFTVAMAFNTTDEAHGFAHSCGLKSGEYAIHGYYF